ncbi:putative f-box protein [Operophtera brumata]|uniref:Putative f-box protein n=1 Tax=Operophtera brumata TaxID=104452 RepID=A0A0L7LLI5_OPEBR|nr:putative f-box protein [Operophtera brumata]
MAHSGRSKFESCPNIEDLNLNKCKKITDQTCQALGRRCSKLQRINVDSCPSITDISLKALSDGCPAITDESIVRLGPKMRRLCLSGCARLSDASLLALAARCPDLQTLQLAQCAQLTDIGFQALARSCRLLERMDLEECVLISDTTLVHLAMGCPRLEKLLITDYGIRQLSLSPCAAEHLTVLGLDNCPLVTDGALEHLTSCHNLQLIELYDCQMVSRNAIRKLRVHAYFAPVTPPAGGAARTRYCRCCNIL